MISVILALGLSSFTSTTKSIQLARNSQIATQQMSGIVITQREVLLYRILLRQWTRGEIPKVEAQDASNGLMLRLQLKDVTGISLAQRAQPGFLTDLRNVDDLLASAPTGYLPQSMQAQYKSQTEPLLLTIVSEGNSLVDEQQNAVSHQIESYILSGRNAARWTLYLLLTSFVLGAIFALWGIWRYQSRHRQQRLASLRSQERLLKVREDLDTAHEVVASLQQENQEKSEIVSTVNHELRTPLTSLIGYIDILKDFSVTKDSNEFQKVLGIMDRNASVVLELVESILSLSALDSRDTLAETGNIDLVERCEKCVAGLYLQIESAHINVSANYDIAQSYTVRGSDPLLAQVFTNLISNAVKFSPKNSRVDITFSRLNDENMGQIVRVAVQDHGIGIPEAEVDRLFSSFFRASNASQNNIPGSGLGLAIVKRIIGLHGGEISIKSKLGEGTTVIVDLPLEISPVESMVMTQRQDVLERAINSLATCPDEKLVETAHDVGGAIGFYTFLVESLEVLNLSRWLEKNPAADSESILARKNAVLLTLNTALTRVKEEVVS